MGKMGCVGAGGIISLILLVVIGLLFIPVIMLFTADAALRPVPGYDGQILDWAMTDGGPTPRIDEWDNDYKTQEALQDKLDPYVASYYSDRGGSNEIDPNAVPGGNWDKFSNRLNWEKDDHANLNVPEGAKSINAGEQGSGSSASGENGSNGLGGPGGGANGSSPYDLPNSPLYASAVPFKLSNLNVNYVGPTSFWGCGTDWILGPTAMTGTWMKYYEYDKGSDSIVSSNTYHAGHDYASFKSGQKTPIVLSPMGGQVVFSGYAPETQAFGNLVVISNRGADGQEYFLFLAHLSKIDSNIKIGAIVEAGDTVGNMGTTGKFSNGNNSSSGEHVHMELRRLVKNAKGEQLWQPVDPSTVLMPGQASACNWDCGNGYCQFRHMGGITNHPGFANQIDLGSGANSGVWTPMPSGTSTPSPFTATAMPPLTYAKTSLPTRVVAAPTAYQNLWYDPMPGQFDFQTEADPNGFTYYQYPRGSSAESILGFKGIATNGLSQIQKIFNKPYGGGQKSINLVMFPNPTTKETYLLGKALPEIQTAYILNDLHFLSDNGANDGMAQINYYDGIYNASAQIAKVYLENTFGKSSSTMLEEGIAAYAAEQSVKSSQSNLGIALNKNSAIPQDTYAAILLQSGNLPSISSWTAEPHNGLDNASIAAGSFVGYLANTYGTEKLSNVYQTGNYESTYAKSLIQLEQDWKSALASHNPIIEGVSNQEFAAEGNRISQVYNQILGGSQFDPNSSKDQAAYINIQNARTAYQSGSAALADQYLNQALQVVK